MRFSTHKMKPFYKMRQKLPKAIDELEYGGREIAIVKYGRPVAALLSVASLYHYRELASLIEETKALLAHKGGKHE